MKTLIKILILFIPAAVSAQGWDGRARWDETPSSQIALMTGEQATELSLTYTHTMVLGGAVSIVSSKFVEKRANKNDGSTVHKFNTKITPAVYGLIGGEFEDFSIIGKLGASYIDQDINGKPDSQKIYFAVGMVFDYKISDVTGLRASYDNVAGAMVGVTIHFNN